MKIKAETLHQAEAELEFLRKSQVEKNEMRKKIFPKTKWETHKKRK